MLNNKLYPVKFLFLRVRSRTIADAKPELIQLTSLLHIQYSKLNLSENYALKYKKTILATGLTILLTRDRGDTLSNFRFSAITVVLFHYYFNIVFCVMLFPISKDTLV